MFLVRKLTASRMRAASSRANLLRESSGGGGGGEEENEDENENEEDGTPPQKEEDATSHTPAAAASVESTEAPEVDDDHAPPVEAEEPQQQKEEGEQELVPAAAAEDEQDGQEELVVIPESTAQELLQRLLLPDNGEFDADHFLAVLGKMANGQPLTSPPFEPVVDGDDEGLRSLLRFTCEQMAQGQRITALDYSPFLLRPSSHASSSAAVALAEREAHAAQRIALHHHSSDEEFARLFVESLYCTQLCALREEDSGIVDWVRFLQVKHDEDQRFFYVDYYAARCLFELVTRNGSSTTDLLVPVAITVKKTDGGEWRSFRPTDEADGAWADAKRVLKQAASAAHQHELAQLERAVQPFAAALAAAESPPVLRRVLQPHLPAVALVSDAVPSPLLPAEDLCLPVQLAKRGFHTWDLPECCVYLKDALRLWKCIEQYCTHVVFEAYASEKDMDSAAIAAFFAKVDSSSSSGGVVVPTKRTELARTLSGVVFACTVQHSALSQSQFAHYACVDNAWFGGGGAEGEEARLPNELDAIEAISRAFKRSRLRNGGEQQFLLLGGGGAVGQEEEEERFAKYADEFDQEMRKIEANIKIRPVTAYGTRYEWLLPSLIPVSMCVSSNGSGGLRRRQE